MKELTMARIPKFANEEEGAEFWDTHSVADYWDELISVDGPLTGARSAKKLVSIRFDLALISAAKRIARTKGIGYQTLLRMWAYEGLSRELRRRTPAKSQKRRTA